MAERATEYESVNTSEYDKRVMGDKFERRDRSPEIVKRRADERDDGRDMTKSFKRTDKKP